MQPAVTALPSGVWWGSWTFTTMCGAVQSRHVPAPWRPYSSSKFSPALSHCQMALPWPIPCRRLGCLASTRETAVFASITARRLLTLTPLLQYKHWGCSVHAGQSTAPLVKAHREQWAADAKYIESRFQTRRDSGWEFRGGEPGRSLVGRKPYHSLAYTTTDIPTCNYRATGAKGAIGRVHGHAAAR